MCRMLKVFLVANPFVSHNMANFVFFYLFIIDRMAFIFAQARPNIDMEETKRAEYEVRNPVIAVCYQHR